MIYIYLITAVLAAHAEPYSQTFTRITGIEPGAYRLKSGPDDCEYGDLVFRDKVSRSKDHAPGIAFVLNGTPLATFLGGKDQGGERKLVWTIESEVKPQGVYYVKRGTMNGKPVEWKLTITPEKDGFTYVEEHNGVKTTCVLTR